MSECACIRKKIYYMSHIWHNFAISIFVQSDMDGCTDHRSLTPPLPAKLTSTNQKENGKTITPTIVHKKDDQIDKNRATIMSSIANKL